MGRKIPAKRHRGVKDPLLQHAKREAELATKINAPPKDVDDQAIPKSLMRIVKLKEAVKTGRITKTKKKKKRKNGLVSVGGDKARPLHPKAKPEKVVPKFEQRPNETEEHFLHRVNRATHAFIKETAFEKQFSVQVNRNPETGAIEGLSKCAKDELDELVKLKAKHKNIKKKKKKKSLEPRLTKSQKRQEKLKLKKEQKEEQNKDEFEKFKDEVQFGEVVHQPPELKVRPKAADSTNSTKPGKKTLLLHSLLNKTELSKAVTKKAIDRTGKRKNLPVGERRQLEKQQSEVIAVYRKLRAQQTTAVNS